MLTKKDLNLMLDIETLGTNPNAIVLSIGAVFFTKGGLKETFYVELNKEDQVSRGRRSTPSTVEWWNTRGIPIPGDASCNNTVVLKQLQEFINDGQIFHGKDVKVWGNGSSFDVTIMEHLFSIYNIEAPWKFFNVRDVRTIVDLYPKCRPREENPHHALEDAKNQAKWVIKAMELHGV